MMDFNGVVVYQPKKDIAGVRPYFVVPNYLADYFDGYDGAPEAELITWAHQFLKPTAEFIDIGTHVGTWCITFAVAGHCKTIGYEAQPWLARLCNAGFAINGVNAHTHDVGMWCERDLLTLTSPSIDGGRGSVVVPFENSVTNIQVPLYPLDIFAHEPGLIKIDVEGAELRVLQGAEQTILKYRPAILMECWPDERGQDVEGVFRYLGDALSYRVHPVNGWPEMWLAEPI